MLVGIEGPLPDEGDVATAFTDLAREAETAEAEHFTRLGLRDRREFFQRYERLAAVVVASLTPCDPVVTWFNPRAKRQVEKKGLAALLRALGE
ncbi:MAG TPA: hypothetical protein VFN03_03770 [Trueperaceae bacterium]|nr:hypothetical protein [Trueperaceae bacterium]